jgi:hypothetical protein
MTQSRGAYFTFGIGPLCRAGCYIIINPGFDMGEGLSRPEHDLLDIDGDGYADYLTSQKDNKLTVRRNRIGRTNLLRIVHRPLGGLLDIGYSRDGNT